MKPFIHQGDGGRTIEEMICNVRTECSFLTHDHEVMLMDDHSFHASRTYTFGRAPHRSRPFPDTASLEAPDA
jgi:hypothetical protein